MLRKIVKTYTKLIDDKIENGTLIVLIIAVLIVSTALLIGDTNSYLYTKSNILEVHKDITPQNNIIEINGVQYKIIFEEILK